MNQNNNEFLKKKHWLLHIKHINYQINNSSTLCQFVHNKAKMLKSHKISRIFKSFVSYRSYSLLSKEHWNPQKNFHLKNHIAALCSGKHFYQLLFLLQFKILGSTTTTTLNIEKITNGNEQLERKLKVLQLEVEVMRQEGKLVPDDEFIKEEYWTELLNLNSISGRKKYLTFLFKRQKTRENEKVLTFIA